MGAGLGGIMKMDCCLLSLLEGKCVRAVSFDGGVGLLLLRSPGGKS